MYEYKYEILETTNYPGFSFDQGDKYTGEEGALNYKQRVEVSLNSTKAELELLNKNGEDGWDFFEKKRINSAPRKGEEDKVTYIYVFRRQLLYKRNKAD